ncbi:MAG: site-2 protease family protein [Clostridia bacterium]|nr:site-2 protease family protein [Clostridia bacterium]
MLLDAILGEFSWSMIIGSILASLMLIFLVSPLHELSHAGVALALGDKTPKWQGRITLNPMAHIDWIGSLMIILFGFGWAKPVQVNMRNFKYPKLGMAITALAGPFSNFLVAFIASLFFYPIYTNIGSLPTFWIQVIDALYSYFILLNIYIGLFNLIPIPPLDGSRILSAVLPNKYYFQLMQYERYSFILFVIVFFVLDVGEYLAVMANNIVDIFFRLSQIIFA